MIWTADARNLLKALSGENSVLVLDSLTLETDAHTVRGQGSLKRSDRSFELVARFGADGLDGNMAKFFMGGMPGPKIHTSKDRWKLTACTVDGIQFESAVFPASNANIKNGALAQITCSTHEIIVTPKVLDATDFGFVRKILDDLQGKELKSGDIIDSTLDKTEAKPSKFHAIFPGVKCLLADRFTSIERSNDFLGSSSSQQRDTFVAENAEYRIGLVEFDGELHVYLELPPSERSELEERRLFSALLDSVAFVHGCHPHPSLKEYSRSGRIVCCELFAASTLEAASIKPTNRWIAHAAPSETMIEVAYRFFGGSQAIVRRIKKTMWLYRDAASEAVPLPIRVLTACTLFEGLVKNLFDAHELRGPTKKGEAAAVFKSNKEEAKKLLMAKHDETVTDGKSESDWSRMAGWLNRCDYVRPKERLRAVAEYFGFSWEGDVEEIYEIWQGSRHGLAHGGEVTLDEQTIQRLFVAWSRLSGAIHRFILAEMGYVGQFAYSPLEAGLETMTLARK